MKSRLLSIILVLSLVSCTPQLGSNGMFKTDLQAETLRKRSFDLDDHKILISLGGNLKLFEKLDAFDIVMGGMHSSSDWRNNVPFASYEDTKLDLERKQIEGPVLIAQNSYSRGLIHTQNIDLIDLDTGQVILSIRVPISNPRNPYPFTRRRETNEALGNALIKYISKNSNRYRPTQSK